jgi:CHAT domain-containing protein
MGTEAGRPRIKAQRALVVALFAALFAASCARHVDPDTLFRRAEQSLRRGRLEESLSAAEQGFRAEPSWRFRLLRSKVLQSISPRQAIDALDAPQPPPTPELASRVAMYRGWAEFLQARYSAAQADLAAARALAAPLHLRALDAELAIDYGTLQAQQGASDLAEQYFRTALGEANDAGDPYLETRAMGSLGVLFLFSHRPDEAVYWLEKDRDASARLGWITSQANALGNLGSAYNRLGDPEQALDNLRKAEDLFEKIGNRREQQTWLGNIGNVLLDNQHYNRAVSVYQRALDISRAIGDPYWTASWEDDLALAYIKLGNFDAAEHHNAEAMRLKHGIHAPSLYPLVNEAGIAAGREDFGKAEKVYREILAGPADDPVPLLQAESGLADVLVKTGQFSLADAQFRAGIARVQSRGAALTRDDYKLSYFSSLIDFDQRYVDFLVDRGQPDRAAEIAEAARARILDDRLNASGKPAPALTVAGLQRLAQSSHAVILSYWLAPRRSFLWVITPETVTLHTLPPQAKIAALVESYRTFIEDLRDPLRSEFPDARNLSQILLGPVLPILHDGVRLIVVPDGALNSLNFETLPDPADASHYLIERAAVAVAPSLDLWAAPRRVQATRGILLIGDPEPAVEEYPRLPYASREMDLIGRNFAPGQTTLLEGSRAFPAAYRAADPARFSSIHFAAHASANRENPLDSALILSLRDGVYALSAREVMEIPLYADLVTLSACRGAGAKTYSGEGLVGLSWAFLRAGAKNVVAGLWDVTDASTASLMADFYGQMVQKLPPADALRAAKLRLIRSSGAGRKPFYWGPFQLYAGVPI